MDEPNTTDYAAIFNQLSDLLKGAVFKEIRNDEIVLVSPEGKEIVVSANYSGNPVFCSKENELIELEADPFSL